MRSVVNFRFLNVLVTFLGALAIWISAIFLLNSLGAGKHLSALYAVILCFGFFIFRYSCSDAVGAGVCFPILPKEFGLLIISHSLFWVIIFIFIIWTMSTFVGAFHISPHLGPEKIHAFIAIGFFAIAEEVLIRGYLLGRIKNIAGCPIAVISTSIIFALLHDVSYSNGYEFLSKFMFGIVLSLLALKYKAILPAIIAHLVFNMGVGFPQRVLGLPLSETHSGFFIFDHSTPTGTYLVVQIVVMMIIATALITQYYFSRKVVHS